MKAEYINPFFEASKMILTEMCGIEISKKQLFVKQGMVSSKAVTITIGVTGMLKGNIIMNLDRDSALKLASDMMGGMQVNTLDEMSMSAVAELGNMIAGRAGTIFSNNKINIDITPPVPALNEVNSKINYSTPTICAPIVLSNGSEIDIDISLT